MSFSLASLFTLISALPYLLLGVVGIGFLITFHEIGHFLFCKLFGIDTPSFSIGFGPALIERKWGNTLFRIAAIPLGGYVEIAGNAEVGQGEQQGAERRDAHSFAVKPYYQKLLVMVGGIAFNLLFAYIAMIAVFSIGIPQTPLLYSVTGTSTIESIVPGGIAESAGLQAGDIITTVNQTPVRDNLVNLMNALTDSGPDAIITLERAGTEQALTVRFETSGARKLGAQFAFHPVPAKSIRESIAAGIKTTNDLIKQTASIFMRLFTKRSLDGMGGPLMIIAQMTQGAQQGLIIWLILLILISINLAVLNVIPLPILDGGQILFCTIEAIIGRPLPEKIRMGIHYASWILMLVLLLYLTIKDTGVLCKNLLG